MVFHHPLVILFLISVFYQTTAVEVDQFPIIIGDNAGDQFPIFIGGDNAGSRTIRKALKEASIIDDVIDDFQPKCSIVPYYSKEHVAVSLGNKFKPEETRTGPSLEINCPDVEGTSGLTVVLTDPDAPEQDNPKWGEFCHWIGVVSGPDSSNKLEQYFDFDAAVGGNGDEEDVVDYKPPDPPPKTGYHRYVFVLLEGDNTNLTAPRDRKNWGSGQQGQGVRGWAKQEGLHIIGANWFIERNEKQ